MNRQSTNPPLQRIAALLHVVRTLLAYGRHLAGTVKTRAAAPSFTSIAACFGTADLSVILARLHRGIMRAAALERVLLARAARGRDAAFVRFSRRRPRLPTHAGQPAPADAAARNPSPSLLRQPASKASADVYTLTLEELERQVRRRPLGRTIVDICLDLAVVPAFCTGAFWNELFEATRCYGGSIANLMRERCRREQAFEREQDRRQSQGWDWTDLRRDRVRQALGFVIGEQSVLPLPASAAIAPAATGPPQT